MNFLAFPVEIWVYRIDAGVYGGGEFLDRCILTMWLCSEVPK